MTDLNEQIDAAVSEWARTLPKDPPEGPGVPDSREALQARVDALTESRPLVQSDKTRIEELERQLRCVQLYGYGYLLNHGGEQIALDPKAVTVVLPATRHMDDFDLHNSLHQAEQKLEWAVKRIDELEDAVESAALTDVFAERDEARVEVRVLQERIRKALETAKVHEFCDDGFAQVIAALEGGCTDMDCDLALGHTGNCSYPTIPGSDTATNTEDGS